jgi:hypothetical protein
MVEKKKTSEQVESILEASYAQEQEVLDMLKEVKAQLHKANFPRTGGPYKTGKDYGQWPKFLREP